MEYEGLIYGKMGGRYIKLKQTTQDVKKLEEELNEAKAIIEKYVIIEQIGLKNKIDRLQTELNEANASLAAAFSIIQDTLKELPVGYIPAHTPQSIPERVRHYVRESIMIETELNEAKKALKQLMDALDNAKKNNNQMSEEFSFKWKDGKICMAFDNTHNRYEAYYWFDNDKRYIFTRNDEPVWNTTGEHGLNARKEVFLKLLNKILNQ